MPFKMKSHNSKSLINQTQFVLPRDCIWILRKAGIANPENGITNNPSEFFNSVLHSLKQCKQVPLVVVCISLFHLSSYYHRELERGFRQCGSMQLKDEFSFHERQPSLMPHMAQTVEPKNIVSRARRELLPIAFKDDCAEESTVLDKKALSKSESQLGLAHDAVANKWVTLAFPGCCVVRGTDGVTPYTIALHPKETSLCSTNNCYHIMACKIMAGQDVMGTTKVNASLLHHNNRRKTKRSHPVVSSQGRILMLMAVPRKLYITRFIVMT